MRKHIVIIFFVLFCICSFLGGVHFNDFITEWNILILTFGLLGFYLCLLENRITKELFLMLSLIILVPLIFFSGLSLIDSTLVSSINDWIGFLGAYLGVIGAIGGIWWQLNEEKINKELEQKNEEIKSLITLLIHIREVSETYKDISLSYCNNKEKDIYFNDSILNYNIELINNLLLKIDIDFRNSIIEIMHLFQGFLLSSFKISDFASDFNYFNKDSFYKEQKEIHNKLFISVSVILEHFEIFENDKNLLLNRLDKTLTRISYIQNRYPHHFKNIKN